MLEAAIRGAIVTSVFGYVSGMNGNGFGLYFQSMLSSNYWRTNINLAIR